MVFEFSKMHGIGNDYVFVDTVHQDLPENLPLLAQQISNRHFGIGSDGLILVGPSDRAAVRMRMFNADGSEAQMCGNGLRCAAKFAYERGLLAERLAELPHTMQDILAQFDLPDTSRRQAVSIETGRGVLTVALIVSDENRVEKVCINMDQPILEPAKIPVNLPDSNVVAREVAVPGIDRAFKMTCVSMGNPHAVIFCDDLKQVDLDAWGSAIERHPIFPERTNVHFVKVLNRSRVDMITWERGSGGTLACGTGAAAVCVAGVLEDRTDRAVLADLPGGSLQLVWNESDDCVYLLGPAVETFRGQYLL